MATPRPANSGIILDNRDVTNTDYINEFVRKYGEIVLKQIKRILGEFYPLIIRPARNGIAGFFKGEDGHYRIHQPFAHVAMIPGNIAMVAADGFLPLNPKGGLGLPTAPILGRLLQTGQQFSEILNPKLTSNERMHFPLAAIVGSTLAIYVSLQSMSLANAILLRNPSLAAKLIFDPATIVANLMQGNFNLYQKFIIGMSGYIGATNAFVKGKEIVLHEAQEWWNVL